MLAPWVRRTKSGRVVYDRPVHFFSLRDVIRVFRGWLQPAGGDVSRDDLGSVILQLVQIAMDAILSRLGGKLAIFLRDLIVRLLKQLLNIASFEDAQDVYDFGLVMGGFAVELQAKGVA